MEPELTTQEMLATLLDAQRAMHRARRRYASCPDRIRDWCQQDVEWRSALLDNLKYELAQRSDAHVIETALRFLLAENTAADDP